MESFVLLAVLTYSLVSCTLVTPQSSKEEVATRWSKDKYDYLPLIPHGESSDESDAFLENILRNDKTTYREKKGRVVHKGKNPPQPPFRIPIGRKRSNRVVIHTGANPTMAPFRIPGGRKRSNRVVIHTGANPTMAPFRIPIGRKRSNRVVIHTGANPTMAPLRIPFGRKRSNGVVVHTNPDLSDLDGDTPNVNIERAQKEEC
ncbi:uncharacterized protein LOC116617166 [Nematostella vectensis]|uniref:uncharacterized protein LOC116617166 n=1 Tax=Nematostella vectensis TaxID=45351 RepID=UPI00138FFD84|nr:uncharacterized protein LOC116617166 [Nematostella vectensis]